MVECPCCKTPSINGEFGDICPECWWELGVDEDIETARKNYKEYGAIDPHTYWCKYGKYLPGHE